MRPQQTVPDIYDYARSLAADGATEQQVIHLLCAQGLHEASARELVQNIRTVREERQQRSSRQYVAGFGISIGIGVLMVVLFGTRVLVLAIITTLFLLVGFMRTIRRDAYVDRWLERRR
jgi:hypothetical protein